MYNIKKIKNLTATLNKYRNTYYNESKSLISDKEYDKLFDELCNLEDKESFKMVNSPTQTVGYEVKSKLEKVIHNHQMLSLDKTKSVDDIFSFLNGKPGVAMLKLDGLTCSVCYNNNELISAESRGNGEIGENILHNAKTISNLPQRIFIDKLIVDGEVIITRPEFEKINANIPSTEEKYKNPRNLASGSIRQLDSGIAAERYLRFIPWKVISGIESNSFCERLELVGSYGFETVPHRKIKENATRTEIQNVIDQLKSYAELEGLPIDGIVFGFDDITYGESLGATGHHVNSQIAFKFYDEKVETILRDIEWSVGKSGQITPVAIFDPVEIDGTEVSRASLHNISILKDLQLGIGDGITVYKANMIIPQIKTNLTKSNNIEIPKVCPMCEGVTTITKENDSEVLVCINNDCKGKILGKLSHAVSKNAFNIEGLSGETLSVLLENNLIEDFYSIYTLKGNKEKLLQLSRFGKKKVGNLLQEIEKSKDIKLQNFLYAWSIPLIGKSASKDISNYFSGDYDKLQDALLNEFDFSKVLDGFGGVMQNSLNKWWKSNETNFMGLAEIMRFEEMETEDIYSNKLSGLSFCITGKLNQFANREELVVDIESNGGTFVSSVNSKTNYLINNDNLRKSSKNKNAQLLNIPIITEEDYVNLKRYD